MQRLTDDDGAGAQQSYFFFEGHSLRDRVALYLSVFHGARLSLGLVLGVSLPLRSMHFSEQLPKSELGSPSLELLSEH